MGPDKRHSVYALAIDPLLNRMYGFSPRGVHMSFCTGGACKGIVEAMGKQAREVEAEASAQ
jgi:hypothetical protein